MRIHQTSRGLGVACGVIAAILLAGPVPAPLLAQPDAPQPDAYLADLRAEAAALTPLLQTDAVRQWAAATDRLTPITPRSIFVRRQPTPTGDSLRGWPGRMTVPSIRGGAARVPEPRCGCFGIAKPCW